MRVSKNLVNPHLEKELANTLHQAIADLKNPEEVVQFLRAFLSDAEYITLVKRVAVAYWLDQGRSYENIGENLKVSSATIAAMQQSMGADGVQKTLGKIKAEEWANAWSQKIQKFVKGA
ncbi:hypothetical protein CMO96_01145 [Candidatus Woesebacteria bacterium]|nr:hypothetical protein [Candidatus Woesebacteria bacterium]|tara:strand:+ start:696 stop:1052 length:357 start_codon:yes stop_codon:yes gene_type:complete